MLLATAVLVMAVHIASFRLVVAPSSVPNGQPAAPSLISVGQARSGFVAAGYQVDEALAWNWTSPPVSTFRVRDPSSERIAMVLVYPTHQDADSARLRQRPLVVGYAAETWRANVAVAQTTKSELDRLQQVQEDCDNGAIGDPAAVTVEAASARPALLDTGFIRALDLSASSL
jgi:hypothetical protein